MEPPLSFDNKTDTFNERTNVEMNNLETEPKNGSARPVGGSESKEHNITNIGSKKESEVNVRKTPRTLKTKVTFVFILVFGLWLYLVDLGLHITIAYRYLSMRNCYRSVDSNVPQFRLDNFVDINSLINISNFNVADLLAGPEENTSPTTAETNFSIPTGDEISPEAPDTERALEPVTTTNPEPALDGIENIISETIGGFIDHTIYVKLRDNIIKTLPEHWRKRILRIVSFQISRHKLSQLPELCTLNGRPPFQGISDMALYICSNLLEGGDIEGEEGQAIIRALRILAPTKEVEDQIIEAALKADFGSILQLMFGDDGDKSEVRSLLREVGTAFNDSSDMKEIFGLLSFPEILNNIEPLLQVMSSIDPKTIKGAANAFNKITPENILKLEQQLSLLNLTLATLIIDPAVFIQFIGNPSAAAVLLEIQKLLPPFTPSDINHVLTIKLAFDETVPQAEEILGRLMSLPLSTLSKVFDIKLSKNQINALTKLADQFLGSDDMKVLLNFILVKWEMLTPEGRNKMAGNCTMPQLWIKCVDKTLDLCPDGHLIYGIITVCILALPGIIFAISEFMHRKDFPFGGIFLHEFGKKMTMAFRIMLLPLYIVVMIPIVVFATIFQYLNALRLLMKHRSPKVSRDNLEGKDLDEIERDANSFHKISDYALQLHAMSSSSASFLQTVIQVFFLLLLVVVGGATLIAGVNAETFFGQVFPLTVASVIVSITSSLVTSWRLHHRELKTLQKVQKWETGDGNKLEVSRGGAQNSFVGIVTFIIWVFMKELVTILSLTIFFLIAWIEIFSQELLSIPSWGYVNKENQYVILALIVLISPIPINLLLHMAYVKNSSPFSLAHGLLSAVVPSRFVNYKSSSKTKKYVLWNQVMWWTSHIAAWLIYCVGVYASFGENSILFKFLPPVTAVLTIGPVFGAVHWAYSINPLYSKTDMPGGSSSPNFNGKLSKSNKVAEILWKLFTLATRLVSLLFIVYIYYEHWSEVRLAGANLAILETVPLVIVLVMANIGLQFACSNCSLWGGLLATFYPNGYLDKPQGASKYVFLNTLLNVVLHFLLYVVLTFYCWECTKILSLEKLMTAFPPITLLWILNLVSTLVFWFVVLKPLSNGDNIDDVCTTLDDNGSYKQHSGNLTGWMSSTSLNTAL